MKQKGWERLPAWSPGSALNDEGVTDVLTLSRQGRSENSTRVQVSRAAGELLWHAAEENAPEQEAHVWGDRGQAQGSGAFQRTVVMLSVSN